MNSTRLKRINSEIQKACYLPINSIISEQFTNVIVSVTKVETTEDLDQSKIFISIFSIKNKFDAKDILKHVAKNASKVREHIAHEVNLRVTPKLSFFIDNSLNEADKINSMIDKIKGSSEN